MVPKFVRFDRYALLTHGFVKVSVASPFTVNPQGLALETAWLKGDQWTDCFDPISTGWTFCAGAPSTGWTAIFSPITTGWTLI